MSSIKEKILAELPEVQSIDYPKEDRPNMASYIDHTFLKPDGTLENIEKLCEEARKYKFASVCIQPRFVSYCREKLKDSPVKVCTVIGFPLGVNATSTKAFETKQALIDGADEIDMVIPVGDLKDGLYKKIYEDIHSVVEAAETKLVKVIIETANLTDEEKIAACIISQAAGAHYVKTSTGFASAGATVEDIKLMRDTVGPEMGVKASGGIRDTKTAQAMIDAGATRLGVSAGVEIVEGAEAGSGEY